LEADFAERLIESFAVNLPTDLAGRGVTFTNQIQIERLLSDAATPADEIPLVLPDLEFDASGATGVDLANLDDDLLTTGEPRVSVDLVVSGLTGSLTVGGGVSIDLGGGSWMVRSAYPGILNRPGFLGSSATGEQRLRVRFEVRDLNGNASVRRPKIADLPMVPVPFVLPAVAQLVAPTMATGGFPLTLQLSNSIPNEGEGFYRVELMDSDATPRKWVLWRFDPLGAADVLARFPVSGALASGTLTVKISTFQRDAGFSSFLWTDLENDYDGYTRTADSTLNHP
jgi:hypothetical protein